MHDSKLQLTKKWALVSIMLPKNITQIIDHHKLYTDDHMDTFCLLFTFRTNRLHVEKKTHSKFIFVVNFVLCQCRFPV